MRINAEISKDGKTLTADTFKDLMYFLDKTNQFPKDCKIKELVIKNASSNFTINDIKNMLRHAMLQTVEWFEIVSPDSRLCTKGGLLYSADGTSLYLCPNGRKGTLIIPDGTTVITDFVCKSCAFSTVMIPDSVRRIDGYSFSRNYTLEEIEGCKNVEQIGDYAFADCHQLKKFPFGERIKTIGKYAFGNTMLTDIYLPEGLSHVGRQAFNTICITYGLQTWVGPSQMYDIRIPSTLKYIEPYAFANAANIYTPFVNSALIQAGMRSGNLKHCHECNIWKLKIDGKPDVIMPKTCSTSACASKMANKINTAFGIKTAQNDKSATGNPPELYQYSPGSTGLTAALEQCRKYPNGRLKRFITQNVSVIFYNLIISPLNNNGEEIMVSLIKDRVFTDTALKKLLEEIEKYACKGNLTTLKAYVLGAIQKKSTTFKI